MFVMVSMVVAPNECPPEWTRWLGGQFTCNPIMYYVMLLTINNATNGGWGGVLVTRKGFTTEFILGYHMWYSDHNHSIFKAFWT